VSGLVRTVVVLAKQPRPGRVKTRLVPPLTHEQAAALAAAALRDTFDAVEAAAVGDRVLAFAGEATIWLPRGWRHVRQPSGGLDTRIVAAFGAGRGPTVLVGMDTPQLRAADLEAFDPRRYDACLGLAPDGGYWAIGFADPAYAGPAVTGVPMSSAQTGAEQLRRLSALGLRVQLLEPMTDVDTIDSAHEVARVAPRTRFAAALAATLDATPAAV
jgi:glycosyltransferase A (GT-A) superfamily protein (DUF2064 family)